MDAANCRHGGCLFGPQHAAPPAQLHFAAITSLGLQRHSVWAARPGGSQFPPYGTNPSCPPLSLCLLQDEVSSSTRTCVLRIGRLGVPAVPHAGGVPRGAGPPRPEGGGRGA